MYGHAIESRDFPGPHCEKEAFQLSESEYRCPQWAQKYSLHFNIRSIPFLSVELIELEETFSDECERGHIPGAAMCQKWKDLVGELEQTVLNDNFDIVLCTCNEAASKRIAQKLKGSRTPKVLQCIVDESGMAYEPETIVPMSLCEHVILLGDHKQLQPVIEYKPAKENGLTTSLFERYAKSRGKRFCTMLDTQYRMVRFYVNWYGAFQQLMLQYYTHTAILGGRSTNILLYDVEKEKTCSNTDMPNTVHLYHYCTL